MYDQFNRKINYLRISLTDRCNLRCEYCIPKEGVKLMPSENILTPDEIGEVVKVAVSLDITKIRLTGGEPLMRDDIVEIVKRIKKINGVDDLSMTTNGTQLGKYAQLLKEAGLDRVNISLDTLEQKKFKHLTKGDLNSVLSGIEAAKRAGLHPIKINFVRVKSFNEEDEQLVTDFCKRENLQLRFIRQMNLASGEFFPVEGGEGGVCSICNRLRLTANGDVKPCLHSNLSYNIRELGIKEAFEKAMYHKPEKGTGSNQHEFYNIGG